MALEAVVFELISHSNKELYPMVVGPWSSDLGDFEEEEESLLASRNGGGRKIQEQKRGPFDGPQGVWDLSCSSAAESLLECHVGTVSTATCAKDGIVSPGGYAAATVGGRRKRRRAKSCRNKEEVENQRMTHIAVERNRRKQMNDYLAGLRSLMPAFYVQKGDQASIVGGAINFVKELEQLLQSLEAQNRMWQRRQESGGSGASSSPFDGLFRPLQRASRSLSSPSSPSSTHGVGSAESRTAAPAADVDVTIVEGHASVKVASRPRPRQLPRMVTGLQDLRLTTLHLNVTTVDQMVLYSFNLRVEEDCRLSSVEEIAAAVHQMLVRIQAEAGF